MQRIKIRRIECFRCIDFLKQLVKYFELIHEKTNSLLTLKLNMKFVLLILFFFCNILLINAQTYNVVDFGAVGDGKTINTKTIQSAIDSCSTSGGGKVIFPPGTFLSGSIRMKSKVELFLSPGSIILGSDRIADYKAHAHYSLLLADGQKNISIKGTGTIEGQGRQLVEKLIGTWKTDSMKYNRKNTISDSNDFWDIDKGRPKEKYRPELINFENCENVTISGITLKDASCWVQTYRSCKNLRINRIIVNSTSYWNNDGIDIVNCQKVRITNCDINSADDGICLKSGSSNVYIADCKIRSSASALKFGTSSEDVFENITVRNLFIYDTFRSAIALECVDGGIIRDVDIRNVKAFNTGNAIFIRLGQRNKSRPPGIVENIRIRNVYAEIPNSKPDSGYETEGPIDEGKYNLLPSSIVGIPGHLITNVKIENVTILFSGKSHKSYDYISLDSLHKVPEKIGDYPEFSMFGELPAWGFYIRHASGISFKNIKLINEKNDFRPAFVMDDLDGLLLNKLSIKHEIKNLPIIILHNVKNKKIRKLKLPVDFLQIAAIKDVQN